MRTLAPTLGISLVIAVLTVGMALLPDPEHQVLVSNDGRATLSGLSRQSQALTFDTQAIMYALPLLGPAYDVGPSGIAFDRPVGFIVENSDTGIASDVVQLYRYDDSVGFWSPVPDVSLLDDGSLYASLLMTGRYAVGVQQDVESPVFLTAYDTLLTRAPDDAVGYVMRVGYRLADGPTIALPALEQIGGCGGVFGQGDASVVSELVRDAVVHVDDVATDVTFVFSATWTVATGGGGCADGSLLEPLIGS
ncbi:MAG: hypothetical protein UY72_C0013G0013 [Candidatus Uhrbacteria bacterium GW2011_GWD2_52_7]|uniref:Uncharacterized protein n=1 Tax=Candidatus Uhrbacteria bacterium GW2011_GWD2_52_7 TaxID=1618989 RepID=A0A0G1XGL2_9BACT|nr:MAG: hypothetical protein UY72_C0013G0013 [Candidatus Uhrbacteria bacterium GW2011_GWD2_52_7]